MIMAMDRAIRNENPGSVHDGRGTWYCETEITREDFTKRSVFENTSNSCDGSVLTGENRHAIQERSRSRHNYGIIRPQGRGGNYASNYSHSRFEKYQ